ncbi:MAG: MarR family transcriptional regulator [Nocardioides sp.]|uniref:MarR family winged helix-turn-helix transcriptional regulator n=1 Tax=Nocardioides sp. TaxID=35761 RepID=UPI0039E52F3E
MDVTGEQLMAAARAMRRQVGAGLSEWGVTPGQSRALRTIVGAAEPLRLSELADRLRIVPRSATEVVDALEGRGLVVRRPDPADRRATCVVATAEGARLAKVLERARTAATTEYLAVLSAEDRRELRRLLSALLDGHGEPDPARGLR